MRNITLLLALVFTLSLSAQKQEAKRFALKSGFVSYTLSGNTTGTKSIYWDDFGEKTREEINSVTEVKMFGMKSKEEVHTIMVMDGGKFWMADLKSKTGQKGTSEAYDMGKEMAEELTEEEAKKLGEDIISSLGGEKMGTEKVLGKTCEVIKVMGAKVWIYKGVSLKTEAKMMGVSVNETATEIKENISVSGDKFKPVSGIEYQDIDKLQNSLFDME